MAGITIAEKRISKREFVNKIKKNASWDNTPAKMVDPLGNEIDVPTGDLDRDAFDSFYEDVLGEFDIKEVVKNKATSRGAQPANPIDSKIKLSNAVAAWKEYRELEIQKDADKAYTLPESIMDLDRESFNDFVDRHEKTFMHVLISLNDEDMSDAPERLSAAIREHFLNSDNVDRFGARPFIQFDVHKDTKTPHVDLFVTCIPFAYRMLDENGHIKQLGNDEAQEIVLGISNGEQPPRGFMRTAGPNRFKSDDSQIGKDMEEFMAVLAKHGITVTSYRPSMDAPVENVVNGKRATHGQEAAISYRAKSDDEYYEDANEELTTFEDAEELEARLGDFSVDRSADIRRDLREKDKEIQRLQRERMVAVRALQAEAHINQQGIKIEGLEKEVASLTDDIKAANQTIEQLHEEAAELEDDLNTQRDVINTLNSDVNSLVTRNGRLEFARQGWKSRAAGLLEALNQEKVESAKVPDLEKDKQDLTNQVGALTKDKELLVTERDSLKTSNDSLINQNGQLMQDLRDERAEFKQEIDSLKQTSQAEIKRLQTERDAINQAKTEAEQKANQEIDSLKQQVTAAQEQVQTVTTSLEQKLQAMKTERDEARAKVQALESKPTEVQIVKVDDEEFIKRATDIANDDSLGRVKDGLMEAVKDEDIAKQLTMMVHGSDDKARSNAANKFAALAGNRFSQVEINVIKTSVKKKAEELAIKKADGKDPDGGIKR